jgi:dinuclear metal center YbgI/SA1388 family protein
MDLEKLTGYLDGYLEIHAFRDDSINGLQIDNNSTQVEKIGLAVDACRESIERAVGINCNLLIVHHGLFWGEQKSILNYQYQRIRSLIMGDTALYAAHLPLDAHPEVGNNVQIAKTIGLTSLAPFAEYHGTPIGMKGLMGETRLLSELASGLEKKIGRCTSLLPFGKEKIHSVGIVSGSATDPELFRELKKQEIDLFITGEPKHGAYYLAQELNINVFYGGHYVTETFGVKALGKHLEEKFNISAEFIDAPCIF